VLFRSISAKALEQTQRFRSIGICFELAGDVVQWRHVFTSSSA